MRRVAVFALAAAVSLLAAGSLSIAGGPTPAPPRGLKSRLPRADEDPTMATVTLYTRVRCHLCDVAKGVLEASRAEHPFALEVCDVDADSALVARYGHEVPVVLINGRKAFKFRVDPAVLRERLALADASGGTDPETPQAPSTPSRTS
jgi:glutaredoxin